MVEFKDMTTRKYSVRVALTVGLAIALPVHAQAPDASAQQAKATAPAKPATYATAEEAAKALAEAVRAGNDQALLTVVGPQAASWISSGDQVADLAERKQFLEAYDVKHAIEPDGDAKATLTVGSDPWPFPAPLLKKDGRWHFDAEAGRHEVLSRRVGVNELDTIQTLLAIVDAQREYADGNFDANGYHDYARYFFSTPGTKDGLYWDTKEGEPLSPLGPLVAEAALKGYTDTGPPPRPYHGYLFRLLSAQGPDAPGGAYDYQVRGRLLGGFAVIAWPAKYENSGIMTFIVSHDAVVYQKDLGDATAAEVAKIKRFNPDKSWTKVKD